MTHKAHLPGTQEEDAQAFQAPDGILTASDSAKLQPTDNGQFSHFSVPRHDRHTINNKIFLCTSQSWEAVKTILRSKQWKKLGNSELALDLHSLQSP